MSTTLEAMATAPAPMRIAMGILVPIVLIPAIALFIAGAMGLYVVSIGLSFPMWCIEYACNNETTAERWSRLVPYNILWRDRVRII